MLMDSLSFCITETILISPLYFENSFPWYKFIGCQSFYFVLFDFAFIFS